MIQALADRRHPAEVVFGRQGQAGVGPEHAPVQQDAGFPDRFAVAPEDAKGLAVAHVGLRVPAQFLQQQRSLVQDAAERRSRGRVGGEVGLLQGLSGFPEIEEDEGQAGSRRHGMRGEAVLRGQGDGGKEMVGGDRQLA